MGRREGEGGRVGEGEREGESGRERGREGVREGVIIIHVAHSHGENNLVYVDSSTVCTVNSRNEVLLSHCMTHYIGCAQT